MSLLEGAGSDVVRLQGECENFVAMQRQRERGRRVMRAGARAPLGGCTDEKRADGTRGACLLEMPELVQEERRMMQCVK